MRYFEVMFSDGYSIAIKGVREPTLEEAAKFTASDNPKCHAVTEVLEISEDETRQFFDCTHIDKWPIFGE